MIGGYGSLDAGLSLFVVNNLSSRSTRSASSSSSTPRPSSSPSSGCSIASRVRSRTRVMGLVAAFVVPLLGHPGVDPGLCRRARRFRLLCIGMVRLRRGRDHAPARRFGHRERHRARAPARSLQRGRRALMGDLEHPRAGDHRAVLLVPRSAIGGHSARDSLRSWVVS